MLEVFSLKKNVKMSWQNWQDESDETLLVTDEVELEMNVATKSIGSIKIGLFGKTVPKTVENFVMLATGQPGYGYVLGDYGLLYPLYSLGHLEMKISQEKLVQKSIELSRIL